MKATLLALIGLGLLAPLPVRAQDPPPPVAPAAPAASTMTVGDFFAFLRALRPLQSGQLTTQLTMDFLSTELKLKLRGDIAQTQTTSGKFVAEVTVTPPSAGTPRRYKVYGDGKTTTIHDLAGKRYSVQPTGKSDDFFVRGLLSGFAREALGKMPPELTKALEQNELPAELAAALKERIDKDMGGMQLRRETQGGKSYTVFSIPSGDQKDSSPVEVFINTTTSSVERLQFKLKQEQLDILIVERVIKTVPTLPANLSFQFKPTRSLKRVPKIDVGALG